MVGLNNDERYLIYNLHAEKQSSSENKRIIKTFSIQTNEHI